MGLAVHACEAAFAAAAPLCFRWPEFRDFESFFLSLPSLNVIRRPPPSRLSFVGLGVRDDLLDAETGRKGATYGLGELPGVGLRLCEEAGRYGTSLESVVDGRGGKDGREVRGSSE